MNKPTGLLSWMAGNSVAANLVRNVAAKITYLEKAAMPQSAQSAELRRRCVSLYPIEYSDTAAMITSGDTPGIIS